MVTDRGTKMSPSAGRAQAVDDAAGEAMVEGDEGAAVGLNVNLDAGHGRDLAHPRAGGVYDQVAGEWCCV